jgi:hypothetical protein
MVALLPFSDTVTCPPGEPDSSCVDRVALADTTANARTKPRMDLKARMTFPQYHLPTCSKIHAIGKIMSFFNSF